jgi:gluconate kinase
LGVTNYLVEGVSGAGKTSVAEELERRGFHVVHGDRKFAYYGDPETGAPLDWPAFDDEAERIAWGYAHWIWPVARVEAIIADQGVPVTFFCGGSRNSHQFIDRFDGVFVLEVDAETLAARLRRRPDDEFGGRALERQLVLRLHAGDAGLPVTAERIDATRPIGAVVDAILAWCERRR